MPCGGLQLEPGDPVAQVGRQLDRRRGTGLAPADASPARAPGSRRRARRPRSRGRARPAPGRRRARPSRLPAPGSPRLQHQRADRRRRRRAPAAARAAAGLAQPLGVRLALGAQGEAVAEPDRCSPAPDRASAPAPRARPPGRPATGAAASRAGLRARRGRSSGAAPPRPSGLGRRLQQQHLARPRARPAAGGRGPRRCARSQRLAAAQPLSTTSSSGPLPPRRGAGFSTGPASARISRAAMSEAQQQQPPGRARRRPLAADQAGQEQERREGDAPRCRRGDPQQQPQGGQGESRQQQPGLGEAEQAEIEHASGHHARGEHPHQRQQRQLRRAVGPVSW